MTTLTITINGDNAAFDPEDPTAEYVRILRALVDDIDDIGIGHYEVGLGHPPTRLRDINGNTVGYAKLTNEEEA